MSANRSPQFSSKHFLTEFSLSLRKKKLGHLKCAQAFGWFFLTHCHAVTPIYRHRKRIAAISILPSNHFFSNKQTKRVPHKLNIQHSMAKCVHFAEIPTCISLFHLAKRKISEKSIKSQKIAFDSPASSQDFHTPKKEENRFIAVRICTLMFYVLRLRTYQHESNRAAAEQPKWHLENYTSNTATTTKREKKTMKKKSPIFQRTSLSVLSPHLTWFLHLSISIQKYTETHNTYKPRISLYI